MGIKIYIEIWDDRDSKPGYVTRLKLKGTFEQARDLIQKFQRWITNFNRHGQEGPMQL